MAIPRPKIVTKAAPPPAPTAIKRRPAVTPTMDELDQLAGEADMEAMASDYESTYEEYGGAQFLKLALGENVVRFLPPRKGQTVPWVRCKIHSTPFGSTPNIQIVCPESVPNEDGTKRACPACKRYATGAQNADPAAKEQAKRWKAKLQVFAEVIDVTSDETAAKGVQIFRYGKQIDDDLFGLMRGRGAVNFFDKREGCPVSIRREGAAINTEYKDIKAITAEKQPIEVEWLRQRPDSIEWLRRLPTREEMEKFLAAMGAGPAAAQAPSAAPTTRPTRPTRPASRPAPAAPAPTRSRSAADDVGDFEYEEVDYE